jgi:DNA-binding winged helix-turn-helix (wHTH) protein
MRPTQPSKVSNLRFDVFTVQPSIGRILKNGLPIKLAPQPFKVLLLLIERRREKVGREEIRDHLWSDTTFVDFERGINFCINRIRTALCDDVERPRYIETLPKIGYRFIAEVSNYATAAELDQLATLSAMKGPLPTKHQLFGYHLVPTDSAMAPIAPVIMQTDWSGLLMKARGKRTETQYRVPAYPLGEGFHFRFGVSNANNLDMAIFKLQLELLDFEEIDQVQINKIYGAPMQFRRFVCDIPPTLGLYECRMLSPEFDYIRLSCNEMEVSDIEVRAQAEGIHRLCLHLTFSVGERTSVLRLDQRIQTIGFFDRTKHTIRDWK